MLERRPPGVRARCELTGSPLRFDDNAFSGGRAHHLPPPLLGEHDEAIRDWLALADGPTLTAQARSLTMSTRSATESTTRVGR